MGLMSGAVFAGGSQFVALDLWTSPAAWMSLGLAALIVNVRHVLMGTSIVRKMERFRGVAKPIALFFLADEIWAFAERRAAERPLTPAFYAGTTLPMVAGWLVSTVAGTLAGAVLGDPKVYGFDFAFIAIFIGLLAASATRRTSYPRSSRARRWRPSCISSGPAPPRSRPVRPPASPPPPSPHAPMAEAPAADDLDPGAMP